MKINKTLIILSLLLVFCISLGAVSAADNTDMSVNDINDGDVATVESSVNVDDEISTVSDGEIHNSSEIASDLEYATGTFNLIHDYKIDETFFIKSSNLIIEGNNHTIYGGGNPAFNIIGNNITIKNINFQKCYYSIDIGSGGAIYLNGNYNVVSDCTFFMCAAYYGGAIYLNGAENIVSDCTFVKCNSAYGGAIYIDGFDNNIVRSCSFVNCSASDNGGAINCSSADDLEVTSCSFVNCSADYGGAIDSFVHFLFVTSCSFVNCSADYGGASYAHSNDEGQECGFLNCSFVNCSAIYNGGAIISGANLFLDNCIFDNNYAINPDSRNDVAHSVYIHNWAQLINNFFVTNDTITPKDLEDLHVIYAEPDALITRNDLVVVNLDFDSNNYCTLHFVKKGTKYVVPMPDYICNIKLGSDNYLTSNVGESQKLLFSPGDYPLVVYSSNNSVILIESNVHINPTPDLDVTFNSSDIVYGDVLGVNVNVNYLSSVVEGNVTVFVDGVACETKNLTDGKVVFELNGLNVGIHRVSVIYLGNENYTNSSAFVQFKVNPIGITIIPSVDTVFVAGAGENYTVIITSDKGSVGEGYVVVLELVNGDKFKNYTLTTDEFGSVSLPINLAYAKNYTFNIYFDAQDGYAKGFASQNITVKGIETKLVTNYTDDKFNSTVFSYDNWTARLLDIKDNPISSVYVNVKFIGLDSNEVVYKIKSDSDGFVKLPLRLGYVGKYKISASFDVAGKYAASESKNITVNIVKANVKLVTNYTDNILITNPNSGDLFKVQLLTLNDKAIKDAKLKINFTNSKGNGNVYTVITDANGFANLTLNLSYVGNYLATVFFEGNINYNLSQNTSITSVIVEKKQITV